MRLIDADAFKKYITDGIDGLILPTDQAKKVLAITRSFLKDIDEQPTVERPHGECKTCKHFVRGGLDGKTYVCEHPYILLDDHFDYACITMNENDFCSRYFPREGDEE